MIELLILGLVLLATVCLWLLIEGRKNPKFLIWFIPVVLILVSSTYITYTTILGLPKVAMPEKGVYISHYIDEPLWIYLWVIGEGNIPKSFQIPYTREAHNSLEGVREEADRGSYMILKDEQGEEGEDGNGEKGGGFTLGGDKSFYRWEHKSVMPEKN
tara:strand:- start:45 stop:518 length:474 start_codon:yes stop_codon:yes gene_type:complete